MERGGEGNGGGIGGKGRELGEVMGGKIIGFERGDEVVMVGEVEEVVEVGEMGGSEMLIRGVEDFEDERRVRLKGDRECVRGLREVIVEGEGEGVVMGVGRVGENGGKGGELMERRVGEIGG